MDKKWINKSIKNKGSLRKKLHIQSGKKISEKQLNKAEHSKNPITRKQAVLAKTLRKINK